MKPKTLITCTLLDKKIKRVVDIDPTYTGFVIDDLFAIGYGLNYDEKYRNLPYIGVITKTKKISNDRDLLKYYFVLFLISVVFFQIIIIIRANS